MKPVRILVFGGRDFTDSYQGYKVLNKVLSVVPKDKLAIISGMARGADTIGETWAKNNGIEVMEFPADWDTHKKAAGPIRNQQMLDEGKPTGAIMFPGGTGTADMAKRLQKAGVRILKANVE